MTQSTQPVWSKMLISGMMYHWGKGATNVPEEPGVYALYDKDQALIYIGESSNLRKDFARFIETDFSEDPCKRETRFYRRELTQKPNSRKNELLENFQKTQGKLPKCNNTPAPAKSEVRDSSFHFYLDVGKPLHQTAHNLSEFKAVMATIPIASLEFHQRRGDFAKWILDIFKNTKLEQAIMRIDKTGENLRTALLNVFNGSKKAPCPTCGKENDPEKTWKMAGRPSKTGERLQLTIGYYKCNECQKTFRQVLNKEKIKTD